MYDIHSERYHDEPVFELEKNHIQIDRGVKNTYYYLNQMPCEELEQNYFIKLRVRQNHPLELKDKNLERIIL